MSESVAGLGASVGAHARSRQRGREGGDDPDEAQRLPAHHGWEALGGLVGWGGMSSLTYVLLGAGCAPSYESGSSIPSAALAHPSYGVLRAGAGADD